MLDRTIIVVLSVAAAFIILSAVFFALFYPVSSSSTVTSSGGSITLESYKIIAYDSAPAMQLVFSHPLEPGTSITLKSATGTLVGVWACRESSNTAEIKNITPPNLVGEYYLTVMDSSGNTIINKSMVFQRPTLQISGYEINKTVKGNSVYISYINITVKETGNSPFYYTKMVCKYDDETRTYKLPLEHMAPGEKKTITIYINQLTTTGEQHNLLVKLSFYGMNPVMSISLSFST